MINKLIRVCVILLILQCWSCGSDDDITIIEEEPVMIDSMMMDTMMMDTMVIDTPFTISSVLQLPDIGLPDSRIERMLSHENAIILLTNDNRFIHFNTNTTEANLIVSVNSPVTDFYLDVDGIICVSTSSKGIYGFDFMGNELFHLDTLNSCMPTNDVSAITSNAAGELFFGCLSTPFDENMEFEYQNGYGLWKMDRTGNNCMNWEQTEAELSGNYIQDLAVAEDNTIWIAASDKKYSWWPPTQVAIDRLNENGTWTTFSLMDYTGYKRVDQLTTHSSGSVSFQATKDPNPKFHSRLTIEIKDDELELIGRIGLSQHFGTFSNNERIFHGSYVTPTEYSYYSTPFLWLKKETEQIDYSSYLTEIYSFGLVITPDDRIWLADWQGIYLLSFD